MAGKGNCRINLREEGTSGNDKGGTVVRGLEVRVRQGEVR